MRSSGQTALTWGPITGGSNGCSISKAQTARVYMWQPCIPRPTTMCSTSDSTRVRLERYEGWPARSAPCAVSTDLTSKMNRSRGDGVLPSHSTHSGGVSGPPLTLGATPHGNSRRYGCMAASCQQPFPGLDLLRPLLHTWDFFWREGEPDPDEPVRIRACLVD